MSQAHRREISRGERFEFGANWTRFLSGLNDLRIAEAKASLRRMLGVESLIGKTFCDVGSGSGLFSLAARMLGAKVHSFDYDPQSVACTRELQQRYFPGDKDWIVEEGSVLDTAYLSRLGQFDVVYSWGVLHHTGKMWEALGNVAPLVAGSGGRLCVAIYNDQGWISRYWAAVKRLYVGVPLLRWPMLLAHAPYLFGLRWIVRALSGRLVLDRGMSLWHDTVDWIGGYPFEVARPEAVFRFFQDRGLRLYDLKTCAGRQGCNEFVFLRGPFDPCAA